MDAVELNKYKKLEQIWRMISRFHRTRRFPSQPFQTQGPTRESHGIVFFLLKDR